MNDPVHDPTPNFDQLLHQVLTEDTAAEPRPGMEQRILARLRAQYLHAAGSIWRRWLPLASLPLVACLVVAVAHHRSTREMVEPHVKSVENTSVSKALLPETSVPALQSQVSPSLSAMAVRPKTPRRQARMTLALANVSYPAPPAPLTDEEKRLLHIAYKADPVQAASLDSIALEAKEQAAREEFQQFFNGRR